MPDLAVESNRHNIFMYFQYNDTSVIICPYCKHEKLDHSIGESGADKCEKCENLFKWSRKTVITYSTEMILKPTDDGFHAMKSPSEPQSEDSSLGAVRRLDLHHPIVHKWLTMRRVHALEWSETMERLVLDLVHENKHLYGSLLAMHRKHGP